MKKTRKAALEAGDRFYKTGKSCKRGHVSKRYTLTSNCFECLLENTRKSRERFRRNMNEANQEG